MADIIDKLKEIGLNTYEAKTYVALLKKYPATGYEAAKLAMKEGCKNKLLVTTTTGEENTGRGAYQSASKYKPNVVVVVDVTYATDYPQTDERGHVALGKGGAICNGSIPNRKLNALLREAAN